ncbi:YbjN domain-containing protein [Reichenbachiella agarivorans]|uniref:YbjN domain-containing protein n=1 Tax=Reichenbachiella agarivorans TaxID=2979464 RepID=A0ABY6CNE0_9BACT|nr:YbjN domain-containing protein [Reichenbachiella agarivorans]UXP30868.1 YbjN domain-containing protein [Reichenbachiella agarivorans]
MKSYAEELNGSFSSYDQHRSVIVVPLEMDRVQAVVGEFDEESNMIILSSKVCVADEKIRFKNLLEQNHSTIYGKFVIDNDFLKVESKVNVADTSEATLKTIIQEVAKLADKWELNLTGKDIF